MLTSLTAKAFAALPYLETSTLMATHRGQVKFSVDKPNVIVGPNGSGKSALLRALCLRFVCHLTSRSALSDGYVLSSKRDAWWSRERSWGVDFEYLRGLHVKTDGAPALFYRPGHIPGNEVSPSHALMMGFHEEAKTYARLTEAKSSGQASQALLADLLQALGGKGLPSEYEFCDWRFGKKARALEHSAHPMEFDHKAEILRKLVEFKPGALPLVMMDEPEQSLDALAQAQLWNAVRSADCSRMQVIVATHSSYPLQHAQHFNLIEAERGYAQKVLEALG